VPERKMMIAVLDPVIREQISYPIIFGKS